MKFQVPQFIETESKVVGPFTFKQFIYIAFGGGLIYIIYYLVKDLFYFLICAIPIAGAAFALAFLKIDDIPLPNYILIALSFISGSKKYQFQKKKENE